MSGETLKRLAQDLETLLCSPAEGPIFGWPGGHLSLRVSVKSKSPTCKRLEHLLWHSSH